MNEALLVSVTKAARILGVGRTSIYAALASQALERVSIGRRTLITMASIERVATPVSGREENR